MRHKTFLIALMLTVSSGAEAQTFKRNEIGFYSSIGLRSLQPKQFFYSKNVSPKMAPTIGGGVAWQNQKLRLGVDMFYYKVTSHLDEFRSEYMGLNSSILAGYRIDLNKIYNFSVQSGFSYTLNHIYLTNHHYASEEHLNTAIFHNFNYGIPLLFMLQRVSSKAVTMGIRAGYQFNLQKDNVWKYRGAEGDHSFNIRHEGAYVQVVFGGLLDLNK